MFFGTDYRNKYFCRNLIAVCFTLNLKNRGISDTGFGKRRLPIRNGYIFLKVEIFFRYAFTFFAASRAAIKTGSQTGAKGGA